LLRAASNDRAAARMILSYYKGSWLNLKLWRGIFRWMIKPKGEQVLWQKVQDTTLIITTYNQGARLKLILDSIAEQTVTGFEIIIADDGSSDITQDVIKEFKAKHPSIQLKHIWQEDKGFRKTKIQNAAVRAAKGSYLIFIDGDMITHPRFIEMHLTYARKKRVLCGYRGLKPEDSLTQKILMGRKHFSWSPRDLLKYYIFGGINEVSRAIIVENPIIRSIIASKRKQLSGCNFSLYKEDFCAVNGFDEDIVEYGYEDYELGRRLTLIGDVIIDVSRLCITAHLYHESRKTNVSEKIREIEISSRTWCSNGLIKEAANHNANKAVLSYSANRN